MLELVNINKGLEEYRNTETQKKPCWSMYGRKTSMQEDIFREQSMNRFRPLTGPHFPKTDLCFFTVCAGAGVKGQQGS